MRGRSELGMMKIKEREACMWVRESLNFTVLT